MNIAWLLLVVNKYGSKIKEAWPSIEHAWQDMQKVIEIFNGGPLMMAGPLSPDAKNLLSKLVAGGIDPVVAEDLVRKAEEADIVAA